MPDFSSVSASGELTLSQSILQELGVQGQRDFFANTTETGEIILRPASTLPVEIYTDQRIAEFEQESKIAEDYLAALGISL